MATTVNLNSTRVASLTTSVNAIEAHIRSSDWPPNIRRFAAQGSWAHKTIIKPPNGRPFDADLLVYVDSVNTWEPKEYLRTLRAAFSGSPVYADKVSRSSHCITIEYAGEKRIDIAIIVVARESAGSQEVCNGNANTFEDTSPDDYTSWLVKKNAATGKNQLRKVTRLLKYQRDIKTTFTCPSVLLTTLLGELIRLSDASDDVSFVDLPTSLREIVGRLDDWLQDRPCLPEVRNPVLNSEVFSNRWDEAKYGNFRSQIHTYRDWIDDAFHESDRDASIKKWRRVFGPDFAPSVQLSKSASVVGDQSRTHALSLAASHQQAPPWRPTADLSELEVSASLHRHKKGAPLGVVANGSPLAKRQALRFDAPNVSSEYKVRWRVTNTGDEARRAGCMRGGFEEANDGNSRWETLAYQGVHVVDAFLVRRSDEVLVAQSRPFFVVIGDA